MWKVSFPADDDSPMPSHPEGQMHLDFVARPGDKVTTIRLQAQQPSITCGTRLMHIADMLNECGIRPVEQ